jgi:hypothetical protein
MIMKSAYLSLATIILFAIMASYVGLDGDALAQTHRPPP